MNSNVEYIITNAQRRTEPLQRAIEIELDTYIMTELYNEYVHLDMAYDQAYQETLMDADYDENYSGAHVFMPNLTVAADILSGHMDDEIGTLSRSDAAIQDLNDIILILTEAAKHTPKPVAAVQTEAVSILRRARNLIIDATAAACV